MGLVWNHELQLPTIPAAKPKTIDSNGIRCGVTAIESSSVKGWRFSPNRKPFNDSMDATDRRKTWYSFLDS